jgi:hypothetical protein
MKLLVISDTLDAEKSVIPYALRLARRMNIQVRVLHIVDPRLIKGIYSAYSDSQTVSTGTVETAEETLKKEMGSADLFLNTMLSREASVLNFPLRVDYQVVEDSIEERLITESKNRDNGIILIASQPDGRFWQDYRDITYVANRMRCPVVLAPRKAAYHHPEKIRIFRLTNWIETGQLNKALCFIGELGISSEVIGQIGPIQKFDPKIPSDVEMLVLMQYRPVFLKRLFSMRLSTVLSKNQQIPILLYNFKARKQPKARTA